jgi:hypothetical protein
MDKNVLVVGTFALLLSCTPAVVNRNVEDPIEREIDKPVPIIPETMAGVRQTYLDTLNRTGEIALSNADFGREIHPTVIQTVEQSVAGLEVRYRIQMFASSSVESLREQKRMMERKVDLPFFLSYEAPFFKLYVGDFKSRGEAEMYLSRVKKHGYTDAWIVTARSVPSN